MKKLALCLLTLVMAIPSFADDLGQMMLAGEPVDTWTGITSNTAEIFGFYTAFSKSTPNSNQNTGDWSTTRTQWLADGTSQTCYRTILTDWIQITNYTTRTLYISLNCTYQSLVSGGLRTIVNETTPTLNNMIYQYRLDAASGTTYPYIQVEAGEKPDLFPVHNIGIYLYDADTDYFTSATMQAEITSTTLVLRGR